MTAPKQSQQPPTSSWHMYRAIVGIASLCALLVVVVYEATAARIRENQERYLAGAISQILPEAHVTVAVRAADDSRLEKASETEGLPVFLAYDANKELVGAVISAQGMGYQDNIKVIYAYSFDLAAIVGLKVLESKETPGLGDRVEKEPHFLANFRRLDATLTPDGAGLLHPITTVKQGQKTDAWQIDGITGATITSEAIGNILHDSASTWVPVLERDSRLFASDGIAEEQ